MLVAQCPSCKRLHPAPKTIEGKKVKCKDCGHEFVARVVSSEDFRGQPRRSKPAQSPETAKAAAPAKADESAQEEDVVAQPIEDDSQPFVAFPRASADDAPAAAAKQIDPSQATSVKCPHCNFCHDMPKSAIGKTITCPSCGNDFMARIQMDDISPEMLASIPTGLAAVADVDDSLSAGSASRGEEKFFSGYAAVNTIGTGEASTIWQVKKEEMAEIFALKQVVKRSGKDFAMDQAENEYQVGSKFNHANVRRVLEIHRVRQLLFVKEIHLVMEHCPGKSLNDYTPGTLVSILNVFLQTAKGLQYIHEQGYVHADICPEHVISSPEGQVKIIDLGECCTTLTVKPKPRELVQFGSPELMLCRPIDKRTDIYSFGATLFWTLVGERPAITEKDRQETLEKQLSAQPAGLRNLVISCIALNPTERAGDMAEVIAKLESLS
ncbi:MAG: protein kinase [Planctomycetes bacterium]|nr:protein kinase [Planctomycetota bacterium]